MRTICREREDIFFIRLSPSSHKTRLCWAMFFQRFFFLVFDRISFSVRVRPPCPPCIRHIYLPKHRRILHDWNCTWRTCVLYSERYLRSLKDLERASMSVSVLFLVLVFHSPRFYFEMRNKWTRNETKRKQNIFRIFFRQIHFGTPQSENALHRHHITCILFWYFVSSILAKMQK